jgi:hypothetical protein
MKAVLITLEGKLHYHFIFTHAWLALFENGDRNYKSILFIKDHQQLSRTGRKN